MLTVRQEGEVALECIIDQEILSCDPARCTIEFSKLVVDLCLRIEDDSEAGKITEADVDKIIYYPQSQITNKELSRRHFITAGYLYKDLVLQLERCHKAALDLPHPDLARTMGFLHDFNKMFSNFSAGEQQSKELDLYFLAEMNGWQRIATSMALHNDYFGIARVLAEGDVFPVKNEAYAGMRRVLQGDGELSYHAIVKRFGGFLQGKDNLPLLVLTVVDNLEQGRREFSGEAIDHDFDERMSDIKRRHYDEPKVNQGEPTPFGKALVEYGGMERMQMYKEVIKTLFGGNSEMIDRLKETTTFFRQ